MWTEVHVKKSNFCYEIYMVDYLVRTGLSKEQAEKLCNEINRVISKELPRYTKYELRNCKLGLFEYEIYDHEDKSRVALFKSRKLAEEVLKLMEN